MVPWPQFGVLPMVALGDFDQIAFATISSWWAITHWQVAATIALARCEIEEATPLWRSANGRPPPPPFSSGLGEAAKSKRGRPTGERLSQTTCSCVPKRKCTGPLQIASPAPANTIAQHSSCRGGIAWLAD
ncbi:hypothetical protein BDU57DRAFT_98053 [Ampelomyces quisqualis]|uniref:Uncharacterized protein n=1 Tax=Ampelomyces quisqualis TaxID=50730 RepID=A0A6A5Q713_AMPQU|nr:hypothetical protein BDU57DRAFT_98053 [Ampelomyces quisqualis]